MANNTTGNKIISDMRRIAFVDDLKNSVLKDESLNYPFVVFFGNKDNETNETNVIWKNGSPYGIYKIDDTNNSITVAGNIIRLGIDNGVIGLFVESEIKDWRLAANSEYLLNSPIIYNVNNKIDISFEFLNGDGKKTISTPNIVYVNKDNPESYEDFLTFNYDSSVIGNGTIKLPCIINEDSTNNSIILPLNFSVELENTELNVITANNVTFKRFPQDINLFDSNNLPINSITCKQGQQYTIKYTFDDKYYIASNLAIIPSSRNISYRISSTNNKSGTIKFTPNYIGEESLTISLSYSDSVNGRQVKTLVNKLNINVTESGVNEDVYWLGSLKVFAFEAKRKNVIDETTYNNILNKISESFQNSESSIDIKEIMHFLDSESIDVYNRDIKSAYETGWHLIDNTYTVMDYSNNKYETISVDKEQYNPFGLSEDDYLLVIIPDGYSLYLNMTENGIAQNYVKDLSSFNSSDTINVNNKSYKCYVYKDSLINNNTANKAFINIIKRNNI
jgi:hypothetical protein